MRNASVLPTLADCLRPGFTRHRALSRASRAWRPATGKQQQPQQQQQRRWNETATWGQVLAGSPAGNPSYEVVDFPNTERASEEARPQKTAQQHPTSDAYINTNAVERQRNTWEYAENAGTFLKTRHRDHQSSRRMQDQDSLQNILEHGTTASIYQRMRIEADRGEINNVWKIAQFLMRHGKEPVTSKLYASLILSHTNAMQGSAHWVRSYLDEMREEGIELDSGLCHDVLKVLAVHPDTLLRSQILDYMRSRWFTISAEGHHDIAAGLLRDGQLELAIEMIDNMPQDGVRVQGWLHDLAAHVLCNAGEFEEALRLLQTRITSTDDWISPAIWFRLLETSSEAFKYEGTSFVWKRRVQQGYLNPPSGICLNVLKLAARRGDIDLATDVFRVLGERGTVFDAEHYELLMEAYITVNDLRSAFSLLCVMYDANENLDLGSVRSLVYYLRRQLKRREEALNILQKLQEERDVPIVAMTALVEAAVANHQLDEALEYYKAMHDVCKAPGRNVDTFNVLLRGCRSASRKDIAMFLASEMVALNITPNALTYDRLILVCLKETDFEDAFNYYFEMLAQGFKPRMGTLYFLARKAAKTADPRTRRLVEDINAFGELAERPKAFILNFLKDAEASQAAVTEQSLREAADQGAIAS